MRSRLRTEKSKNWQKHHRTKAQKDQNQSGQNPPKMRKYFNTPTTKVYNRMINWYRCRQSTFSSCNHVGGQWKAKLDKSKIVRKPKRIRIKAYKTPKKWDYILIPQQSRCTIPWSRDIGVDNQHSRHAITWADRESKNGQKHHRTKAPKDQNQSRQTPP